MTKEQLAERLNGRQIGNEITKDEAITAKRDGLLVIYGSSDDLVELAGMFSEECGAYNGTVFYLHSKGVCESDHDCECRFCGWLDLMEKCAKIRAIWCFGENYSWTYETSLPHATFDVLDGNEKYCRGIVIDARDLPVL